MTEATFLAAAGVTTADALANGARGRRDRELAQVRRVAEAAQQVLLRPVPRQAGQSGSRQCTCRLPRRPRRPQLLDIE
jgi:hypothetical protein